MESGFSIGCHSCGHERHLKVGTGVTSRKIGLEKFSQISDCIEPEKIRLKVRQLLENRAAFLEDFGHLVYSCPKCGELFSHFHYRVRFPAGTGEERPGAAENRKKLLLFRPRFSCPHCRVRLKRLKADREGEPLLDLASRKCPRCGQKSLEYRGLVLWD